MFNIESELLYAIAQQESAMKPGAIGHNRDGSTDLGLMQINSFHMKRLKKWGLVKTVVTGPLHFCHCGRFHFIRYDENLRL